MLYGCWNEQYIACPCAIPKCSVYCAILAHNCEVKKGMMTIILDITITLPSTFIARNFKCGIKGNLLWCHHIVVVIVYRSKILYDYWLLTWRENIFPYFPSFTIFPLVNFSSLLHIVCSNIMKIICRKGRPYVEWERKMFLCNTQYILCCVAWGFIRGLLGVCQNRQRLCLSYMCDHRHRFWYAWGDFKYLAITVQFYNYCIILYSYATFTVICV